MNPVTPSGGAALGASTLAHQQSELSRDVVGVVEADAGLADRAPAAARRLRQQRVQRVLVVDPARRVWPRGAAGERRDPAEAAMGPAAIDRVAPDIAALLQRLDSERGTVDHGVILAAPGSKALARAERLRLGHVMPRKTRQSGEQVACQCAEEALDEGLGLGRIGWTRTVLDLQVGQHAENMA